MVAAGSPIYARIIDDLGRRQYSGKITWLREYIQNALDGGSSSINIRLRDVDLVIEDDGKGMDYETLINQAFAIANPSKKGENQIGELGIGMFAGVGVCDALHVKTKMVGKSAYVAKFDIRRYYNIIDEKPNALYDDVKGEILDIEEDKSDNHDVNDHFTLIRFERLSRDTLSMLKKEDLIRFIENTVNVPLDGSFPKKNEVKEFLGEAYREIPITLEIDGETTPITRYKSNSITFTDTFWSKDIINDEGKTIGKIWAVYNKEGQSFEDAKILLKFKGLTIGDSNIVKSRFNAKLTPRFYGEIILLDNRIQVNTSRDWFVESPQLATFVEKTKMLLGELQSISELDSNVGVGVKNLVEKTINLKNKANQIGKENPFRSMEYEETIEENNKKINNKIKKALKFKEDAEKGTIDINDPTVKMKLELVNKTLNDSTVTSYVQQEQIKPETKVARIKRKEPWPKIAITFLKENIIDSEFGKYIGKGDAKDITNRAFTFIEQKLKKKLDILENQKIDWDVLINQFVKNYAPPDLKGGDKGRYIEAFKEIMRGNYTILRNPAHHTFMSDMNDARNILEIIMITDFVVRWIDQWNKNQDPVGSK